MSIKDIEANNEDPVKSIRNHPGMYDHLKKKLKALLWEDPEEMIKIQSLSDKTKDEVFGSFLQYLKNILDNEALISTDYFAKVFVLISFCSEELLTIKYDRYIYSKEDRVEYKQSFQDGFSSEDRFQNIVSMLQGNWQKDFEAAMVNNVNLLPIEMLVIQKLVEEALKT
uniref:Uncharacterized protein n=1 Tax=Ditylenchus dipsaci TaxID=166011 RepID=A0A915DBP6_9BILA